MDKKTVAVIGGIVAVLAVGGVAYKAWDDSVVTDEEIEDILGDEYIQQKQDADKLSEELNGSEETLEQFKEKDNALEEFYEILDKGEPSTSDIHDLRMLYTEIIEIDPDYKDSLDETLNGYGVDIW